MSTFNAINPATGEPLDPPITESTREDVNRAAKAAVEAFAATKDLEPRWQADLLDAIAARIMDLGDGLLERAEAETALPRARLTGERGRTTGQLQMFAKVVREGAWVDAVIDTADANRKPVPKPDLRRINIPRGPVAVFGASNFPFAFSTPGGDTASALAAGCPVIVKGHPSHPGTSELFAGAIRQAIAELKFPAGLFALLQGRSHELSNALVTHPSITAVGFTGSLKAGRALFDLANARANPIPVYAEMGSVNPLIVMPGALKDRAEAVAQGLAGSILMGVGQFCTKPGIIFTLGDADAFIAMLAKHLAAAPTATMLNAGLRDNFLHRVSEWPNKSDVKWHHAPKPTGAAGASPGLLETSADFFNQQPALKEEAFGPAAVVVRCDEPRDIQQALESIAGSLTGTIHTGPGDDPRDVIRMLEPVVGRVILNGFPTGVEVNHSIVHGGPYPATTFPNTTSVGSAAISRWTRLIAYQDTPDTYLPPALQNGNPLGIERVINGQRTSSAV